ncbi:hypothetical protein HK097_008982 [Rhizophlyctis rosea]|uniref:Uncharacterized protein n=1 Tax=Rhizophlyctis rosea TaxID=64517 RepID=A0AAD5S9K1_9FUNG|nr:hypothetical protein HK097_008982 [Rhizophlyctis rosea]
MNELGSFVFCGEENGFGRKLEDSIRRYCRGDGKFFENMFENDQLKSFIVFVQRNPELFTFSKNLVVYCQIVVNLKTTFKTAEEVKLIRYVETTKDTFGEDSEEAKAAKEKLDAVLEKKKLLPALTAPPVIPLIQDAARDSNGERLIPKSEVDKMIEEAVAETVKKQKSVREKYQNSYKELEIELQDVKEKLQHAMERKEKYKKDVEHLEEKIEDHQQLLEENPVLKRSYIDAIKKEKTRKNKDVDDGNKASKRQKIQ